MRHTVTPTPKPQNPIADDLARLRNAYARVWLGRCVWLVLGAAALAVVLTWAATGWICGPCPHRQWCGRPPAVAPTISEVELGPAEHTKAETEVRRP